MLRSLLPCVLLVAACQYAGRDLGADADPLRPGVVVTLSSWPAAPRRDVTSTTPFAPRDP